MRAKGIVLLLILNLVLPMSSIAEEKPTFEVTFFDRNADGIDDRMDHLILDGKDVAVILMLSTKPSDEHVDEINNLDLDVTHIYKYIDAIRIDSVPAKKVSKLTLISDLKLVEWQAPVYPFLDTAVKAIKVRESSEYNPVVWDKGLYGEGINVAVLDTGVDNEHETFDVFEDQGVRRFIAGMNCDGGCPTDGDGKYQFTTEEDSNEDPDDFDGHGTHVASTVLGMGGDGLVNSIPNESISYRDHVITWGKELQLTIDYLYTRVDIDKDNIAYYGWSWGGRLGGIMVAIENRFKTALLMVGGMRVQNKKPEADPLNFLPRIKIPVLMLNGRYDHFFPVETSQLPMYKFLGTKKKDKKHMVYDTGHSIPFNSLVKESLDWLEKYLN